MFVMAVMEIVAAVVLAAVSGIFLYSFVKFQNHTKFPTASACYGTKSYQILIVSRIGIPTRYYSLRYLQVGIETVTIFKPNIIVSPGMAVILQTINSRALLECKYMHFN